MCPDFHCVFCSLQMSLKVPLGFITAKEGANLYWEEDLPLRA